MDAPFPSTRSNRTRPILPRLLSAGDRPAAFRSDFAARHRVHGTLQSDVSHRKRGTRRRGAPAVALAAGDGRSGRRSPRGMADVGRAPERTRPVHEVRLSATRVPCSPASSPRRRLRWFRSARLTTALRPTHGFGSARAGILPRSISETACPTPSPHSQMNRFSSWAMTSHAPTFRSPEADLIRSIRWVLGYLVDHKGEARRSRFFRPALSLCRDTCDNEIGPWPYPHRNP